VTLVFANLNAANHAIMFGAKLSGARLIEANLSWDDPFGGRYKRIANLSDAYPPSANLSGANPSVTRGLDPRIRQ
jgi:uncharacterized protein YjbI with pentapeptide repeats